jgi:hypothetical protein
MPISFNNLVEKSRSLSLPMANGSIELSYNPSKLSAAFVQEMQEKAEENDPLIMAKLICHVVSDWDIEGPLHDEDHNDFVAAGDKIPLEPRYVAWIPGPVLTHIMEKIGEDASPKSQPSNSRKR